MTPPDADFKRWPYYKLWFGQRAERFAARYLRRKGHRILAANVHDGLGELDLITLDGGTVVVVEVRSTSRPDPQVAADTVDYAKQKRVCAAALRYLGRRKVLGRVNCRFDIVAVAWPPAQANPAVLHLVRAFDPTGRFQFFS